ncbi:hypothetical protein B0O99DRAFT_745533 [Bisporella sp. PMI_857]|nr:hypothetical protein B0O99DRAFT_745533 [Bisporella sp. PMI_857]
MLGFLDRACTNSVGGLKNEEMLANLFVDHTPSSTTIPGFARAKRSSSSYDDKSLNMQLVDELSEKAIPNIPDLRGMKGYSNGHVVEANQELSLFYLSKATGMDSFEPTTVASNIYNSYCRPIPDKIGNIICERINSNTGMGMGKVTPVLFSINNPVDVDFDQLFVQSWGRSTFAKECP